MQSICNTVKMMASKVALCLLVLTVSFGLSIGRQQQSTRIRNQLRLLEQRVILDSIAFQEELNMISAHMNVCCSTNDAQIETLQQPNNSNINAEWEENQESDDFIALSERKIDLNIKLVKQGFQEEKRMLRQTIVSLKTEMNQVKVDLEAAADSLTSTVNETVIEIQARHSDFEMSVLKDSKYFEEKISHNIDEFKANMSHLFLDNVKIIEQTTATMLLNFETLSNATTGSKESLSKEVTNTVSVLSDDIKETLASNKETIQRLEILNKILFESLLDGESFTHVKDDLINRLCGNGWVRYKMSCYLFLEFEKTWQHAVDACSENSYLVEIDSADENKFITETVTGVRLTWIGLSDIMEEGNWLWQNSQRTGLYRNWAKIEPNNAGGFENCAELSGSSRGVWNDMPCNTERYYICEKDLEL